MLPSLTVFCFLQPLRIIFVLCVHKLIKGMCHGFGPVLFIIRIWFRYRRDIRSWSLHNYELPDVHNTVESNFRFSKPPTFLYIITMFTNKMILSYCTVYSNSPVGTVVQSDFVEWCTPRTLTPWWDACRRDWLSGMIHTAESNFLVGCTLKIV